MSIITVEQADAIERKRNVYVDRYTSQFNLESHDVVYGWQPIPEEWQENSSNQ